MAGRLGMTGSAVTRGDREVYKALTDMSEADAKAISAKYPAGRLPKHLDRPTRMKAYEARYVAAGGPKAERWGDAAEGSKTVRNAGIGAATGSAAALLALKGKRTGPAMARTRGLRKVTAHRAEVVGLAAGVQGGAAELFHEHAKSKRSSYTNSPGGVAASALTRMRNYPGGTT